MMEKITRFRDIPKFSSRCRWSADMVPDYLLSWIKEEQKEMGLNLEPDFQRGHVWTRKQQIDYITYCLQGGTSGRDIYFNCMYWDEGKPVPGKEYVCIDGLQRITAWDQFLKDQFPVFGSCRSEFIDRFPVSVTLKVHVNDLQTREEVLRWYLGMNSGGTDHDPKEIERVMALLKEEKMRR